MQKIDDLAKTFSALGEKTRFRLYQLLGEQPEICVSQLASTLRITPACVSQHMKILAEAGLVTRIRDGQRVCYKLTSDTPSKTVIQQLVFN